jgi:hypothetical protein
VLIDCFVRVAQITVSSFVHQFTHIFIIINVAQRAEEQIIKGEQ